MTNESDHHIAHQGAGKLRETAKEHFNQPKLNDEQLAKFSPYLKAKVNNAAKDRSAKWRWLSGVAASICLMLVGWLMYPQSVDISVKIANEVAMNHIKMRPLEVKSQNIMSLRDYFTELDFSITQTSNVQLEGHAMLGGRYCSIQGVTAAQIRFVDQVTGSKVTLYEVGYNKQLYGELPDLDKGEQPKRLSVNGIDVALWVEKGLLMAEAKYAN